MEKLTPKASSTPLPRIVVELLAASAGLSTTGFILSMSHTLGYDSLWTVPAAWFLTIGHHLAILILSRRRTGPLPLPPAETSPIQNVPRTSVYHPAAKTSSETAFSTVSEHPEQEDVDVPARRHSMASFPGHNHTARGQHYPSFTRTNANCIATCALAIIWTVAAILPVRNHVVDMSIPAYFLRNFFPIPEAGVMWALFVLFIRAQRTTRKEGAFMRMDNC